MKKLWIAVAVVVGLLAPAASVGALPAGPTRDGRTVAFSGPVTSALTHEAVALTGQMRLDTAVSGSAATGWAVNVRTQVQRTTGIGQTTGLCYVAGGTDTTRTQFPPSPIIPIGPVRADFSLLPIGPIIPVGPTFPPNPCTGLFGGLFDLLFGLLPSSPIHPPNPARFPLFVTVHFTIDGHIQSAHVSTSPPTT